MKGELTTMTDSFRLRRFDWVAFAALVVIAFWSSQPCQAVTFTTLYNFTGQNGDGATPYAMAMAESGVLYGVTTDGGTLQMGTVFSLTPPGSPGGVWTEAVLWSFGAVGDG